MNKLKLWEIEFGSYSRLIASLIFLPLAIKKTLVLSNKRHINYHVLKEITKVELIVVED